MPYINLTSHEKLLRYVDSLNIKPAASNTSGKEVHINLCKDIDRLDEIAKAYKQTIVKVQELSDEYESVHKKARLSLRKLKMASVRKINKYYKRS